MLAVVALAEMMMAVVEINIQDLRLAARPLLVEDNEGNVGMAAMFVQKVHRVIVIQSELACLADAQIHRRDDAIAPANQRFV